MIKFQSFLSGSSGNGTFVTDDETHVLVDCGTNGKYITECMRRIGFSPKDLSAILITHEHRDHIAGAGVLSRKFNLPIYATEKTWLSIGDSIGAITPENKRVFNKELIFNSMKIHGFSIPHDAADPLGYSFITEDDKFTIATDLGHLCETVIENLKGSRSVIVEANHDLTMLKNGPYPYYLKKRILGEFGHLSNEDCGFLCAELAKSGTEAIWLGHLSRENNRPQVAYETVSAKLSEALGQYENYVTLQVLSPYWIKSGR